MSKKCGWKGLDWEPVRAEFVNGPIGEDGGRRFLSYKDLAKKYCVSSSMLSQRGKAEEWPKQRDEARRNVAEAIDREAELTKSQLGKVIGENLQYFLVRYVGNIRLMVNIRRSCGPQGCQQRPWWFPKARRAEGRYHWQKRKGQLAQGA
ncbi:hypothetical protein GM415_15470 [Pseudodesulfovibrio cashew]|uniref:Uncharacterized protein n=1 Tax=Pseudodesulfovibrio cashew TaxID=2678688 RepID=A0A6I6JF53_9BACT|nr:hypothetical protein [Pseudodesulfovibrio cashew]QGY41455.1 hypothetical protein GM415_15470 [Pseudodesulfovibrio cashew]